MKILLGFFIGTTFSLLLVIGLFRDNFFAAAETDTDLLPAESAVTASTDSEDTYTDIIPDVEGIYKSALGAPYRQVESEITDPDIAAYYRQYMEETGLDKVGLEE